MFVDFLTYNTY